MAPAVGRSTSLWNDTEFVIKCVSGNAQNRIAHDKLGLPVIGRRPDGSAQFEKPFANKLYARVIGIAQRVRLQYGKRTDERNLALLSKKTLEDECSELEDEFGQDIRGYQQSSAPDLRNVLDSATVQFYLHCWIAICVRQSTTSKLSEKRIEEKANETVPVHVQSASPQREDANPSEVCYRAPEARMVSELSRDEPLDPLEPLAQQERDGNFFDQFLHPAEPSVIHESSSKKRKAVHDLRNRNASKLPKISRTSESTALDRARGKDVYSLESVPRRTRSLSTIGRATPGDTRVANTYRGRVNSDDAEADREDVAENETHNEIESSDERERTIRRSVGPLEGPSNPTNSNIVRATVHDRERETTAVTIEDEQQRQHHTTQTNSSTNAQTLRTSELIAGDIKQSRKELSELLLEYLLGRGRFKADNFDVKGETVMDQLLRSLSEIEKSRSGGDDLERFTELSSALETWISVRKSLGTFREAVKYYGQPGEDGINWANHLDQLKDPEVRIESVWALVKLKRGLTQQQRELIHWDENFHDNLVDIFDMLIRRKMFGKATFEFVKVFNEGLLQWFSEDECSE